MKVVLLVIVLGLCGIGWRAFAKEPAAPAIGLPAPDFTLPAQDGHPVALHEYRGQWVVLYFYPRDASPGCTLEAHGFQRDLPSYAARHAVILGVSLNSVAMHADFCARDGLNFKLLSDGAHDVAAAYGSLNRLGPLTMAARHTFIIDPKGIVAASFMDVSPARHSADVLAALERLQSPAR